MECGVLKNGHYPDQTKSEQIFAMGNVDNFRLLKLG
jgi:hypothetical protein